MTDKPFDSSLKDLIEQDHLGWARHFNPRPVVSASFVDADVSTVQAATDKVLRVEDDLGTRLIALEPLTYHDSDVPRRAHLYATVLHYRHQLPVRAIILLLRREANAKVLTGTYEVREPGETTPYETFRYQVVKLWEEPLAPLLTGSLGVLPLAPLTDEAATNPEAVVRRINERLQKEARPDLAGKMQTMMFILMGLRYDPALVQQLYEGVNQMEESATYQLILSHGECQRARQILLRLARKKLGEPDSPTLAAVEAITDPDRLESLVDRVSDVDTWQDLLKTR